MLAPEKFQVKPRPVSTTARGFVVSTPEKPPAMNAEAALEHLRSDGFLGVFAGDEWAGLDTDGNVVVSVGGDERTVTADEFCAQFASATFRVPTAEEVA